MKINSEVSKLARFGEDAIEGFNTAVENGQARLAMSILVDVINAFDEKFDDIDEKLAITIKPEETLVEEPKVKAEEPKPKVKEQATI
jgi:hypothetical protein